MTYRGRLFVWLESVHVATLEERRNGLWLVYTEDARRRWGLGHPLISFSLPITLRPHHGRVVERFFDGLLPEGQLRRTLAYDFRISETDTYGLLREIGRDCAGALVVQPESDGPPESPALRSAELISREDVVRRIADLPLHPLGVDQKIRVSLAGMQNKLLLVRLGDDTWGLPKGGAPSTHILKPEMQRFSGSVENEAFCMRLARRLGLSAATIDLEHFGGKPVLVVERFDRNVLSDGEILRLHQEDVNQALAVEASKKYESNGGPTWRRIAQLLRDWRAPVEAIWELLRSATYVTAVGNADHHTKNISLLHKDDGRIRLAPLYDVTCTRRYPEVTIESAMFVNGKQNIDDITTDDLVTEGVSWGMSRRDAEDVVLGVFESLPAAIDAESETSPWAPPELVEILQARGGASRNVGTARSVVVSSGPGPLAGAPPDGRVWVQQYRRADGTTVTGHWRQAR